MLFCLFLGFYMAMREKFTEPGAQAARRFAARRVTTPYATAENAP
jgi:hypothetical protein